MFQKIANIILLITLVFSFFRPKALAEQKNTNYKMPFRSSEVWNMDPSGGYGVHKDSRGFAFDFYAPDSSSRDILAPIDGILGRGCTVDNTTFLSIKTEEGDILRFMHIDASTVLIDQGEFPRVKQGDVLGKITGGGTFEKANCKNSSDGPHVHFSWLESMCDFKIDGYVFDCSDTRNCGSDEGLYEVPCNKKNPAAEFRSTNKANYLDKDCSKNMSWDYTIGEYGMEIIKLQKCLKERGLFNHPEGITGYFGNYTSSQLQEFRKNGIKNATQGTLSATKSSDKSSEKNSSNNNLTDNLSNNSCDNLITKSYKIGDQNDDVKKLQQCLTDKGLFKYPAGITGYFGNYTLSIIKAYQSTANSTSSTNSDCATLLSKTYKIGDSGDSIKSLQQCLKDQGSYSYWGGITGYYGTYTNKVLIEYRNK